MPKYCPICGMKNFNDSVSCIKCNANLEGISAIQIQEPISQEPIQPPNIIEEQHYVSQEVYASDKPSEKSMILVVMAVVLGIAILLFGVLFVLGSISSYFYQPVDFQTFISNEGNFSILMPGTPKENVQNMNSVAGQIPLYMYMIEKIQGAYVVGYSDFPSDYGQPYNATAILDGACNGAVTNVYGQLTSELSISLNGYPGREISISYGGDKALIWRIYLVNNRLYQVGVLGYQRTILSDSMSTYRFLDSFVLL